MEFEPQDHPVGAQFQVIQEADLADFYALSYALQMQSHTGDQTAEAMRPLSELLEKKEKIIALASIDAITRELVLYGATGRSSSLYGDLEIEALAEELDALGNQYLSKDAARLTDELVAGHVKEEHVPRIIGTTILGMRLAAYEMSMNGASANELKQLSADVGAIGRTVFEAIARNPSENIIASRATEAAAMSGTAGNRNWLRFAEMIEQFGYTTHEAGSLDHVTAIDQLINAQHDGTAGDGAMLYRTTNLSRFFSIKQLLDAKHNSNGSLIMNAYASLEVKGLLESFGSLSILKRELEPGETLFQDKSLSGLSGKVRGLVLLKALGYKVPDFDYFPTNEIGHLYNSAQQIAERDAFDSNRWAVRSSANIEDGTGNSFAGLFTSHIGVTNEQLGEACRSVGSSARSEVVEAYCAHKGIDSSVINMDVIIQKFEEPILSGVWIGDPAKRTGALEWVSGRGEALVGGLVDPKKEYHEYGDPEHSGITDENGVNIAKLCQGIEARVGCAVDLEFVVTQSGLQWVQIRPVTAQLGERSQAINTPSETHSKRLVIGEGVSPFTALGRLHKFNPETSTEPEEGAILVSEKVTDKVIEELFRAGGLITNTGGRLSHAAILCRELGLPYVTGVDITQLKHGRLVRINGETGTVTSKRLPRASIGKVAARFLKQGA